jgi:hypothetical protein
MFTVNANGGGEVEGKQGSQTPDGVRVLELKDMYDQ